MNTLNHHSDMPILTTKFYIPLSLPDLVSRPHLIQRLNSVLLRRQRMTLVAAPAGFGKTTLIAAWLRVLMQNPEQLLVGTTGLECAWLSLEDDDNNPTRFFTYFIATIENVLGSVGDDIHSLLKSPSPSQLKAMLTILINNLAAMSCELVIVLDDYHLIADTTIHEALGFFIDHLPPQVHLVIISRMDPPLPLARLRTRGQLTELRAADLRFTPEETTAFFQDVMGLLLSTEDIAALEVRTEGWIAGLQLAALSLRGRLSDNVTDFIMDFSGSNRHIIDYLADEVIHQLDADVYSFLCQTAILEYLTAPLCDILTGRDDSKDMLRYLEQANLFVVPLDQQRKWYRYHHLFADFLLNNLRQDMPEQIAGLHHNAAHWYEQHGMLGLAVNHILATEDFEAAALLIEQIAQPILARGEFHTLLSWLRRLPESVVQENAKLSILFAEALAIAGELDRVEFHLHNASWQLEAASQENDQEFLSELLAIRAYLQIYSGDFYAAVNFAQQALDYLPENNAFIRSILLWVLGFTHYFDRDFGTALNVFGEVVELGKLAGSSLMVLLSMYVSSSLLKIEGRLKLAEEILLQGVHFAQADVQDTIGGISRHPSPGLGGIYQMLGIIAYEQNDLVAAEEYMSHCIELVEQWGNAEIIVDSYIALAFLRQSQGDSEAASVAMSKAELLATGGRVSEITVLQVNASHARLWLSSGNLPLAVGWANSLVIDYVLEDLAEEGKIMLYIHSIELATLTRVYLAQEKFEDAYALTERMLCVLEPLGWWGCVIEVLALQSLSLYGFGDTDAALAVVERAVSYAGPEGYCRVFVDMHPLMKDLLHLLALQTESPAYVTQLLKAFRPLDSVSLKPVKSAVSSELIEPLTERELEILQLLVEGLSNREIGQQLVIALGTVKRHISNIYGKLGVHTRTQAIARTRALSLLNR